MSCCGKAKNLASQAITTTRRIALKAAVSQDHLMRHVSRWRKPEDRGLGDTLQHVAEDLGGRSFSNWLAKWGIECDCEDERAYWNDKVPYSSA